MSTPLFSLQVTTSRKGFDPVLLVKTITNNIYMEVQGKLEDVARECVEEMRKIIAERRKRDSSGQNNLENAIDYKLDSSFMSEGGVHIGIGNIDKLNALAPYWNVLDSGFLNNSNSSYIPYMSKNGAPLGSFNGQRPVAGGSGKDNWERSGVKGFFMKPKKPIEGIHYILIASESLTRKLDTEVREFIQEQIKSAAEQSVNPGKDMWGKTYVAAWGKKVRFYKEGGVDMG